MDTRAGIQQVLEAIARGDIVDYRDAKYSNVKFLSMQGTERLSRSTWAHEMLKEITAMRSDIWFRTLSFELRSRTSERSRILVSLRGATSG